jgi:hypothetical protein
MPSETPLGDILTPNVKSNAFRVGLSSMGLVEFMRAKDGGFFPTPTACLGDDLMNVGS